MSADPFEPEQDEGVHLSLVEPNPFPPYEAPATTNGRAPAGASGALEVESWETFKGRAAQRIPMLVRGVLPEGAFGFLAAPPKAGKTWAACDLAVALVTGTSFLGTWEVPAARHVLYVALEGNRSALRDRLACLTRGRNLDPDKELVERLHILYKPPGVNLSDPVWADRLRQAVAEHESALTIVDVLRSAAVYKENDVQAFAQLRANVAPIFSEDGRALLFLHHFGKLSEVNRDRRPGERMAGTGAMEGALDVGLYITASEDGARRIRVEYELRDLASPPPASYQLTGTPSGDYGTFAYDDAAGFEAEAELLARSDIKAPAELIATWIRQQPALQARPGEILDAFDISEGTLRDRRGALADLGVEYIPAGRESVYRWTPDPATADPAALRGSRLRGQKPHEQAKLTPQTADPAVDAVRGQETPDLQALPQTANPQSPTETSPALRDASDDWPVEEDDE